MRKITMLVAAAAAAAASIPSPALSHGDSTTGTTTLVIGWANEPAFAGYPNAVEVHVEHDGEPRAGARLNVVVVFGDENGTERTDSMRLDPAFGETGTYRADLIPTSAGTYTFIVTGRVAEDQVNVTMTSGDDTFDDVVEPTQEQFPEKVPGAVEQRDAIDAARTAAIAAQESAEQADAEAATAKTLATAGLAAGVLGLLVGGIALMRRRAS